MTSNRDIIESLTEAGRAPVEPFEPRLERLEARLMATIADDDRPGVGMVVAGGVTDVVGLRRARRARLTLLAAAAAIVAVVVLAFTIPGGDENSIVIASADDVSVVLPDGSRIAGSDGLELPEGARLEVIGALRIGDLDFGPGAYIVTADGVVPLRPTTTSSTTTTSVAIDIDRATTVAARDVETRPAPTDVDRTVPAPTRTPTTTLRPPPTRPATTVRVTRPATTVPITRPATTVAVTRPATTVPVTRPPATRPTTTVAVTRPATTVPASTRPPATDAPTRRRPSAADVKDVSDTS